MRRLVVGLVTTVAALAAAGPAGAEPRAFQAVCEAQGGTFTSGDFAGAAAELCAPAPGETFSERQLVIQSRACGRAEGGLFVSHTAGPVVLTTACLV